MKTKLSSFLLLLVGMQIGHTAELYVAPNGSSSNSGAIDRPLSLAAVLSSSTPARPGDTIWMRGGSYSGRFDSYVSGSSSSPILIRNYNNERATLTGHITVYGSYIWFWGLEAMDPNKQSQPELYEFMDIKGGVGIKLINCIIHDHGIGVVASATATDFEAHGCVMYHCGKNVAEHAFYLQNNNVGLKRINDCLIGSVAGYGVHFYANAGQIKGLMLEGNAIWNSGALVNEYKSDILVGGGTPVENVTITKNYTYTTRGKTGTGLQLGYGNTLNVNAVVTDNYFANFQPLYVAQQFQSLTILNNTVHSQSFAHKHNFALSHGPYSIDRNSYTTELDIPFERPNGTRLTLSSWRSNTGFDLNSPASSRSKPGNAAFARANRYERGRGHVIIYNWSLASSVSVDVSSILPVGWAYEIRNAQDYYGPLVATGLYTGGSISFPMQNLSVATPLGGFTRPPSTAPEFGAFVITSRQAQIVNTPPTLSNFSSQSINQDTATSAIGFTVGDSETSAANLGVLGSSSNPNLVPSGNIRFGGSGSSRTVTVTPVAGQTGNTTVSVSVTDGSLVTTKGFPLTVNAVAAAPSSGSAIVFEAESGAIASPMAQISNSQASNGQCVSSAVANQGTITFTFNIPAAGDYYVWCHAYASYDHDSVFVSADGGTEDVYDFPKPFDAWTWGLVRGRVTGNPRKFNFSAGTHRLIVRTRESETLLDRFVVTSDPNYNPLTATSQPTPPAPTPTPAPTLPIILEAESGALASPMIASANSQASGGRCITSAVANQGTVTFALNLPVAGDYYVWIRAFASHDHDSIFVSADGGSEDVFDLPKPFDAWNWGRVRGRTLGNPRKFALSAGNHSLVIRARETNTLLDRVIVTNDPNYLPSL